MEMVHIIGECHAEETVNSVGGEIRENHQAYIPVDYFNRIAKDPKCAVLVSVLNRPGLQLFVSRVEYDLFPPKIQSLSQALIVGTYNWDAYSGLPFLIMAYPRVANPFVSAIAADCDLQFIKGKTPTPMSGSSVEFPIGNEDTFRLENKPGSPVYTLMKELSLDEYKHKLREMLEEDAKKATEYAAQLESNIEYTNQIKQYLELLQTKTKEQTSESCDRDRSGNEGGNSVPSVGPDGRRLQH